jgi:dolichol kinase
VSLVSLIMGLAFISSVQPFDLTRSLAPAVAAALVCTLVEVLSPRGLDNLAVPILGALTFGLVSGGF